MNERKKELNEKKLLYFFGFSPMPDWRLLYGIIFQSAVNVLERGFVGSSGGAVVRALASHQCGSGSILGLGVKCGLSLLLVLVLALSVFSLGTPFFNSVVSSISALP